jgi:hypothetical protein
MPRNGSGVYSPPAANYPAVSGTLITAANRNAVDADVATALTGSLAVNGESVVTANIPFSGNKLTGIGAATARTDAASIATIQDGTGVYSGTVGGTADVITITPSPAITAYGAGQLFSFIASGANTTNVTINVNGLGAKAVTKNGTTALVAGDIPSGFLVTIRYDGTRFQLIGAKGASTGANGDITSLTACTSITAGTVTVATGDLVYVQDVSAANVLKVVTAQSIADLASVPVLKDYFSGGIMSTAGSSATMSIAAWYGTDSTNAVLMTLAAIAKTTSAWAVGTATGGLDTGAIANTTWYHFYAIRRPDTGVVDVVFSTSASSPTLPANYTQFRYIGSGLTNGSAQWVLFSQVGDTVLWDAAVVSFDAVNPGTSAVSRTVQTPLGVKTLAKLSCGVGGFTNSNLHAVFSSLDVSDQAAQLGGTGALTGFSSIGAATTTTAWMFGEHEVRTNTSSQIRTRLSASSTNDRIGGITRGWRYIR